MIHLVRARIKGMCKRCKDGGDVEVCMSTGVCYQECVYCHLTDNFSSDEARKIIMEALSGYVRPAQQPTKKVVKKRPADAYVVAPVKKKKKKRRTVL